MGVLYLKDNRHTTYDVENIKTSSLRQWIRIVYDEATRGDGTLYIRTEVSLIGDRGKSAKFLNGNMLHLKENSRSIKA